MRALSRDGHTALEFARAQASNGRAHTRRDKADAYEPYLRSEGIPPLEKTDLGVQLFREDRGDETEFVTISYWPSEEAMSAFTGGDLNKVHHLPRDAEFLIELPERIAVMRILFDDVTSG